MIVSMTEGRASPDFYSRSRKRATALRTNKIATESRERVHEQCAHDGKLSGGVCNAPFELKEIH